MPLTRTVTDLQRNMGEVSAVCHETRQPVYITKNGDADLVLMDAEAFDEAMELRDLVYEREKRTYEGIMQGREEIQQGLGQPYSEVRKELGL